MLALPPTSQLPPTIASSGTALLVTNLSVTDLSVTNLSAMNLSVADLSAMNLLVMDLSAMDLSAMDLSAMDLLAMDLLAMDVRNMVFFELFPSYFMTFRLLYLLTFFSLNFTLPRKDKTRAIEPIK